MRPEETFACAASRTRGTGCRARQLRRVLKILKQNETYDGTVYQQYRDLPPAQFTDASDAVARARTAVFIMLILAGDCFQPGRQHRLVPVDPRSSLKRAVTRTRLCR